MDKKILFAIQELGENIYVYLTIEKGWTEEGITIDPVNTSGYKRIINRVMKETGLSFYGRHCTYINKKQKDINILKQELINMGLIEDASILEELEIKEKKPLFEIKCLECGSINVSIKEDIIEDEDFDGNRTYYSNGFYLECQDCGNSDY